MNETPKDLLAKYVDWQTKLAICQLFTAQYRILLYLIFLL